MTIKTAVFPVGGMGTRFLPVTKSSPKEMLPIIDRPLIQYAVEEAVQAGVEHLIFITNANKRSIEDYFDTHFELEARLLSANKKSAHALVRSIIPSSVHITYIRQPQPRGLGDALLQASHVVSDPYFAVLLADDFVDQTPGCLQAMIEQHEKSNAGVVAVERVLPERLHKYGVVGLHADSTRIEQLVEKPSDPSMAPSDLAVIGRYVLSRDIFSILAETQPGAGGEVQLTDALKMLLPTHPTHAYKITGQRFDCGEPCQYLQAAMVQAMKRPELKSSILSSMAELLAKHGEEICLS